MKLVCYNPALRDMWNDFIKSSKNGLFMFDRNYMEYHSDRFTDHSLLVYSDEDKLLAVLPANKRDDVLYSHQGLTFGSFVTDASMKAATMLSIFDALKQYMAAVGIKKLVYKAVPHIYHTQPAEEDVYALFRHQARLFRVDVTTTINLDNALPFAELRKRGQKKAHKNGVVFSQSADWDGFMAMLSGVLQERHDARPVHTVEEMKLLSGRFPQNIKLYTATQDDSILAGVVIFEYAHIVHAQYIAVSPAGRDCGALDGLFGELIQSVYAKKSYFDFGISTEKAGIFLNEGLIGQKEGFGGRAVTHAFYEMIL